MKELIDSFRPGNPPDAGLENASHDIVRKQIGVMIVQAHPVSQFMADRSQQIHFLSRSALDSGPWWRCGTGALKFIVPIRTEYLH